MSINQKIPYAVSSTNYIQSKIDASQEYFGQILPCVVTEVNGSFVTVNFQVDTNEKFTFPPITCPIAESFYVRLPVQVGDTGICIPAATRLGGITGLNNTLAPLGLQPNLGGLVFVPIGNKTWTTLDPNAVVISASNGAIIRTNDGKAVVTIADDKITVAYQSVNFVIDGSKVTINGNLQVNGTINATGDISSGSVTLKTHTHNVVNVQGGLATITTTVGAG